MRRKTKTLLITGVSSGLGRAFAVAALEVGHTVVGTVRSPEQIEEFAQLASGRAHARRLDVTRTTEIPELVSAVESEIGPIDVLVNNAGYAVEGTFEETPLEVFRRQFDVNVFGVIAVTQAVLPFMRARRAGHVVFVTSMGGLRAFPGLSAYHGSKYAVEGVAAALRQEVEPLGIKVTALEPGSFRTDWSGRSMDRVPERIDDYAAVFGPARERRLELSGRQPGDPTRAGKALIRLIDDDNPPGHLMLGTDALNLVAQARDTFDRETAAWASVSASTDFPADSPNRRQEA